MQRVSLKNTELLPYLPAKDRQLSSRCAIPAVSVWTESLRERLRALLVKAIAGAVLLEGSAARLAAVPVVVGLAALSLLFR